MQQYYCYGLNIACDTQIIGLELRDSLPKPDINVYWHSPFDSQKLNWQNCRAHAFRNRPRITTSTATNDTENFYRFEYDMARFGKVTSVIATNSKQVWLDFPAKMTVADRSSLFLGTILGSILRLKGYLCLHSSVLRVDRKALLLIGASYAGKSTTAAALNEHSDVSLIADDIAVLKPNLIEPHHFDVLPGYPSFRLHSDAAKQVYDKPLDTLKPVYDGEEKYYLPISKSNNKKEWNTEPVSVDAMCILNSSKENFQKPTIDRVSANQGLLKLTSHTYANYAVLNSAMIQKEFNDLAQLLQNVPLYESHHQKSMDNLPSLCEALLTLVKNKK